MTAQADTRRMAETGTGSGRSPSGTVPEGNAPDYSLGASSPDTVNLAEQVKEAAAKAAWRAEPLPEFPVSKEEYPAFRYGVDCAYAAIRAMPTPTTPVSDGLREALEPFAELAANFISDDEDDHDIYKRPLWEPQMQVRIDWLRKALAALSPTTEANGEGGGA